ncbi:MAG: hypothetical protein H6617_00750 [Bdellovibrionaceae bacterium]|nr:hypothetical protein [Bdellovibrionales bacterium]MCB9253195.1 hypothetical protein [Pseudobdellovibrionaceae bacterium]
MFLRLGFFLALVCVTPLTAGDRRPPLEAVDRLAELIECEHQSAGVAKLDSDNVLVIEAKIKEAQADVEYYKARIQSVQWLHSKAQVDTKYDRSHLERMQKLHLKNAISKSELEDAERNFEHSQLNERYIQARVEELKAELKASEARLSQVQAATN